MCYSETAGCLPGLLESLETTKAHLEFINQIQTVDVGSQPIEAKPLVDASGIYQVFNYFNIHFE